MLDTQSVRKKERVTISRFARCHKISARDFIAGTALLRYTTGSHKVPANYKSRRCKFMCLQDSDVPVWEFHTVYIGIR